MRCQRYFSRPRVGAAAHQRGGAGGIVHHPHRAFAAEIVRVLRQKRAQRPHFNLLIGGERWQNRGQTLRQHGFARARRADHQQAVPARRRDFQRQTCRVLPFHVFQIQRVAVFRLPLAALRARQRFKAV